MVKMFERYKNLTKEEKLMFVYLVAIGFLIISNVVKYTFFM